jgi:hypothetical protein
MADDKKNEAAPKTPTTKPAEPKAPPPTQEQLDESFEGLVEKLEGLGHRDDPDVAEARAMLDSKAGGKDAPKGG